MRTRAKIFASLPLILAMGLTLARGSDDRAAQVVRAILEKVPAAEVACQELPEGAGPGTALICARVTADATEFRDAWDRAARQVEGPRPLTDWVSQVGGRMRWYALEDKWIVATHDTGGRSLMIAYPKSREGVYSLGQGVTAPQRLPQKTSSVDERREARRGLRDDTQGVVVLSAVIRKDGVVDDVQILGCLPRGQRLEQAAVRTIKRWRYTPGTLGGQPVAVGMAATFTYGPGGTFRVNQDTESFEPDRPRSGERGLR